MASTSQQAPAGLTPLDRQRLLLRNNLNTHVMCSNPRPCRYGDRCMFAHSVEESRVMRAVREAERAKGGSSQDDFLQRSSTGVSRTTSDGAAFERSASGGSGNRTSAGPVSRTTSGSYFGSSRPGQQRWGGQGQGGEAGGAQQQQQQQQFCPPSRYKTALCTHWMRHGECRHADACTFAHGEEELREYTRYVPNRYGHYRSSTSASTEVAIGDGFGGHTPGRDAEAEPDELAAAYPEEFALQQQYDLRRQHAEQDRQLAAAAVSQPPPPPPGRPPVLADSEQFPSLGGAGTSVVGAPPAAEAAHGGRAGMQTMAAVLTKHMSCEWEGVSTTSSGAPTTACLSEPALKPEYSSGASVAGSVRSVGMAESEDGSLHSTTTTAAKQAQNAHPTAAAPAQEHQAAASSALAAEPAGLASTGSAASLPAAKGAEEERAEAAVVGSGQQAGSGASWADMADDDDDEEEQQQEEESAGLERQQEGDAEAATAAEDVDSAAAAEPKQQQQQQRASLTPAAVSPAAPPGLTSGGAVSSAAQVKLKVPSPLPLPMVQRPSGAMPTVEYRDASTSPLPTSLLPQAQPACQPAPAVPAPAPQAAAYHPHHGASHHTLPLPPPPPPPPGFCPPPSPRAAYGPAGAHPQQPAHPSAASSIRAAVGRHPIAAQAPAQPAFMQRMSYPGTVDLTLVPAFTCPLTGHLFVNPVVAADGITYEKEVITDWLFRHNKEVSPVTGKQLAHRLLLPNDCLRSAMTQVAELMRAMVV
ncbi:hypothetical protein D9Q98_009718 [Chlorella vulgaris]|uniref:Uncharacterized protein n=1 Tax=Chlorella vulgaris TaxID=3077 RepID=A0A9D4TEY0_CHLVU|nr:hypothetical protein D9Q98_009718 [Chlorella vulgaris]